MSDSVIIEKEVGVSNSELALDSAFGQGFSNFLKYVAPENHRLVEEAYTLIGEERFLQIADFVSSREILEMIFVSNIELRTKLIDMQVGYNIISPALKLGETLIYWNKLFKTLDVMEEHFLGVNTGFILDILDNGLNGNFLGIKGKLDQKRIEILENIIRDCNDYEVLIENPLDLRMHVSSLKLRTVTVLNTLDL